MFYIPTQNEENMAGYAADSSAVYDNLNNSKTSYNITGTDNSATTTFGLVIKGVKSDSDSSLEAKSCALVKYENIKSNGS
jgi:hypothetical protein